MAQPTITSGKEKGMGKREKIDQDEEEIEAGGALSPATTGNGGGWRD